MNKCIYTLKTEPEAHFTSAEHIFPKSLGGIQTLEKGWVSDEFNNAISKYEREFVQQYPLITLNRMFLPKQGRKSHKGKFNISFQSIDTGNDEEKNFNLGYIEDGNPVSIEQVINDIDDLEHLKTIEYIGKVEDFQKFLSGINKYSTERMEVCYSQDQDFDKFILGLCNKKIYIGVNENISISDAQNCARLFIRSLNKLDLSHVEVNKEVLKGQVTQNILSKISLDHVFRVYAKIAFNVLAKLNGQKFVLNKVFNDIRNAIVTGQNIRDYVHIIKEKEAFKEAFSDVLKNLKLKSDSRKHMVIIQRIENSLIAIVSLYIGKAPSFVMVSLVDRLPAELPITNSFDGYICDFETKKEMTILEWISQNNNDKSI